MKKEIREITQRIMQLIEEMESYEFHKLTLLTALNQLKQEYEKEIYTYNEYTQLLSDILKGKSKAEWVAYYDLYILSLMKKVEPCIEEIARITSKTILRKTTPMMELAPLTRATARPAEPIQKSIVSLSKPVALLPRDIEPILNISSQSSKEYAKPIIPAFKKMIPSPIKPSIEPRTIKSNKTEPSIQSTAQSRTEPAIESKIEQNLLSKTRLYPDTSSITITPSINNLKIHLKPEEDDALNKLEKHIEEINKETPILHPKKLSPYMRFFDVRLKLLFIRLHSYILNKKNKSIESAMDISEEMKGGAKGEAKFRTIKSEKDIEEEFTDTIGLQYAAPKHLEDTAAKITKKEKEFIKKTPSPYYQEEIEKKPSKFKLSIKGIKKWYTGRVHEEEKFLSKEISLPHSMQLEGLKKKILHEEDTKETRKKGIQEEMKSIRVVLEKSKSFKIYKPSYIGVMANVLIRKFTFSLIDMFPDFFKNMYNSIRLANIPVLSNTYVNIMVMSTLISSAAGFMFFSLFFIATNNPAVLVFIKSIIMSILLGGVTFLLFYMHPLMKIQTRQGDIKTNLPFAINHISAVAGSGVPPTKMFTLLVESGEYGEIGVEFSKIVEYIDLFGYDLLTSIRTVALTSPSQPLKEFLEGVVSTIESGGNLNDYLKEKSDSAMLSYELERQKYLENISTYSDVYTGILIAAPLFFVVALSLVSMLGGTIGGIQVNVLIIIGGYVVIPLLNVLFLVFLEMTQPAM